MIAKTYKRFSHFLSIILMLTAAVLYSYDLVFAAYEDWGGSCEGYISSTNMQVRSCGLANVTANNPYSGVISSLYFYNAQNSPCRDDYVDDYIGAYRLYDAGNNLLAEGSIDTHVPYGGPLTYTPTEDSVTRAYLMSNNPFTWTSATPVAKLSIYRIHREERDSFDSRDCFTNPSIYYEQWEDIFITGVVTKEPRIGLSEIQSPVYTCFNGPCADFDHTVFVINTQTP